MDEENTMIESVGGGLSRFLESPILKPVKEHAWESRLVFNCGAYRVKGVTYIIYRAMGYDKMISCWGLAVSKDGISIDRRLDKPIFVPTEEYELPTDEIYEKLPYEKGGCEDPHLLGVFNGRLYVSYTGNSGNRKVGGESQLAFTSIRLDDFISLADRGAGTEEWMKEWRKEGLAFKGYNKDGVIIPEKINDKYILIHRPYPDMRITYTDELVFPWTGGVGEVLLKAEDIGSNGCDKIGAGAQAIKTEYGWLLICHGREIVDRGGKKDSLIKSGVLMNHKYFLFTMLLDLKNPSKILYVSPPILEPEKEWEKYGWVNHVVFTCGAVPRHKDSNKVLDKDDKILIYYGGADNVIGVARASVSELIPGL